jgi:hypothetical protein
VSLDGLPPAHLRVLLDGLPVFEQYGLLLAGGYAFRAHEILHRPSQGPGLCHQGRHSAAGGLDEPTIADLRNWVTGWYDDLAPRLVADLTDDEVPDDL